MTQARIIYFTSCLNARFIWPRNDLANFKQCLKALEQQVNEKAIILTDTAR